MGVAQEGPLDAGAAYWTVNITYWEDAMRFISEPDCAPGIEIPLPAGPIMTTPM